MITLAVPTATPADTASYFEEVGDGGHLRHVAVTDEASRTEIDAAMARLSFTICLDAPVTQ